jgi:hypothetical protein
MTLTRRSRYIAIGWATAAFVVWNAVFDRLIVLSGRQYIRAAVAADAAGTFLTMEDWMRPAVVRAFWVATAVGTGVALLGVVVVWRSVRRQSRLKPAGSVRGTSRAG